MINEIPPSTPIHAHSALDFIAAHDGLWKLEELDSQFSGKFGTDARFFACSADNMTTSDLVAFLLQRQKIFLHENRVYLHRANVCNH